MRRRAAAIGCALVALALGGCGEEDEAAPGAAADAVPADAVLVIETVLRPEGEQRGAIEALAERLPGEEDPGEKIVALLDEQLAEDDAGVTYEADIEPWLGERAAVFFTSFEEKQEADPAAGGTGSFEEHGAFVLETTDPERATEFLEQVAAEDEVEQSRAEYEGYEYLVDEDRVAGGVIGDVLVFGNEGEFQAAIDTVEGEDGLAEDESFAAELDAQEREESLASLYLDVERAIEASGGFEALDDRDGEAVRALFPRLLDTPALATASATESGVSIDASFGSLGALGGLAKPGESLPVLGELPGDAWLATAGASFGRGYVELLDAVRRVEGAALDESQLRAFERAIGIDLERALGAFGDAALYVRGTSIFELEGAAVIENLDPGASRDLIAAIGRGARSEGGVAVQPASIEGAEGIAIVSPEVPEPVNVVADADRIVIGYGSEATVDSLAPTELLRDSERYRAASELVGGDVPLSLLLDFGPLRELLDALPVASPEREVVRPYLDAAAFLAFGGSDDGERTHYRFVLEAD